MKKQSVTALLFLSVLLLFTACIGKKPENTVDKFCAAIIAFDGETASQYTIDGSSKDFVPQLDAETSSGTNMEPIISYIKENATKITYEIGDVTVNDDSATVTVHFTFVDASPIMVATAGDYLSQAFLLVLSGADDSTIESLIVTIFQEKVDTIDTEEKSVDIEFDCEKIDNDWKIAPLSSESQEDLFAVLTSNITNAAESIF